MKFAWIVLIISGLTDALIVIVNGLTSAMVSTSAVAMPSRPVILINILFGVAALARTVQQALKATPETSAALKGDASTFAKTP